MKNFLLIDDHEVIRSGIKGLLIHLFNDAEVHEAGDGYSALEKLKIYNYDLILMDVQVPNSDMFKFMEYIHTHYPGTKVLVFSMSAENIYAKRFLKAGAAGFLSKDASIDEIKKAILLTLENRIYISETLAQTLAQESISDNSSNPFNKLSMREFEIATLFLSGQTITDISKTISLHTSTVSTHKRRFFVKLGVRNILELKELATTHNLLLKI